MTILDDILAHKRVEVAARQQTLPIEVLQGQAASTPLPRDLVAALRGAPSHPALIAEIKRASPSRGLLRPDLDPVHLAHVYQENGAAAISVLTDERFFQGRLDDLRAVRQAVALPLLCKDFIFDPYQVYEARAAGADAVLLIVAMLGDDDLRTLHDLIGALGMTALVEVHDEAELRRALRLKPRLVGVNNRDLRTFKVDIETIARLRPLIPDGVTLVAESGIHTPADVARLAELGVDAILVGESLVTAENIAGKVRELAGASEVCEFAGWQVCRLASLQVCKSVITNHESRFTNHVSRFTNHVSRFTNHVSRFTPHASRFTPHVHVKICGITTLDDALAAIEAGADMLGFNFYHLSPRYVTPAECTHIVSLIPNPQSLITFVGVFVNSPPDEMRAILDGCGLHLAQLSGDEPPEFLAALDGRAFKGLRPATLEQAQADARRYACRAAPALLVDAHRPGAYGGTGQTGDWGLARALAVEYPILLAGGLTPENVAEAVVQVRPWGVDVASGVESGPGRKDAHKMAAFVRAAKAGAD